MILTTLSVEIGLQMTFDHRQLDGTPRKTLNSSRSQNIEDVSLWKPLNHATFLLDAERI